MNISFTYVVPYVDITSIITELTAASIPYKLDWNGADYTIGLPDLPVREYAVVHRLFGVQSDR